MIPEEQEAAEKTRKLRLASEAKRILSEPLMISFFETQEVAFFEALKRLEFGTKLEEYQTIHFGLKAVIDLKTTLQTYIQEADLMALQDQQTTAEDI